MERLHNNQPVSRSLLEGDPVETAPRLLGHVLANGLTGTAGIIVEVEAYRQDDPASHSFRGRTRRTEVMFGPAGFAYVYLIYGVHECFNIVCGPEGEGAAILVRALEPVTGWEEMWRRRYPELPLPVGGDRAGAGSRRGRELTAGPGRVCQALGISRARHQGVDLCGGSALTVYAPLRPLPRQQIAAGTRIGISRSKENPWRFWISGNRFVSR